MSMSQYSELKVKSSKVDRPHVPLFSVSRCKLWIYRICEIHMLDMNLQYVLTPLIHTGKINKCESNLISALKNHPPSPTMSSLHICFKFIHSFINYQPRSAERTLLSPSELANAKLVPGLQLGQHCYNNNNPF